MKTLAFLFCVALAPAFAAAQPSDTAPNDAPNAHLPGVTWGRLPDGRRWGSTGGVDIAPDGTLWAYDRCGGNNNGCTDSPLDPILHFDTSGRLLGSFGANMFNFPHGIAVDRDGNVWVTDHGTTPANSKGQVVYKFSPTGQLLLTLGTRGVAGTDESHFTQPSDVVIAPGGDIFVADGHAPGPVARIVKFDRTGTFLKTWASRGTGDAQLNGPHGLAMDSTGRLFVGDRSNNRIQIYDQEGTLLASWKQFGRPSGIFIDRSDTLWVTDSESRDDQVPGNYGLNPGVRRGIRFGSVKDGKVVGFIPDPNPVGTSSAAEGVAVDGNGNVYGAEVGPRDMKRYVKAPPSMTTIDGARGPITITPLMHASVQIEYAGQVIQVDPAMGDFTKARFADLVFVTDVHEDHFNASRILQLRKTGGRVVVPAAVQAAAKDTIAAPLNVITNGQTRAIAGISVQAVPMYNIEHKMGDEPFHTKGRGNGYVITVGGKRLYFAGDTECVPEIKALRNIDVAFLPMNLPFTMSPEDAAACAQAFKPRAVIPYHFLGGSPDPFVTATRSTGLDVRLLNWYPTVERPDTIAIARPGILANVGGGRTLHLHCTGQGQPTVLLSSASGLALDWSLVQPEIARNQRVCSYDRAGRGWSAATDGTDSDQGATNDLFAALAAANERPPYLVVGAGTGAMVARLLQLDHANEVTGAVFIDGFHEDQAVLFVNNQPTPARALTGEAVRAELEKMRPPTGGQQGMQPTPREDAPFDRLPGDVLKTRVTFDLRMQRAQRTRAWDAQMAMFIADHASFVRLYESETKNTPPFGDRPLISLRPGIDPGAAFKTASSKLAGLSSSGIERTIAKSGPEIYLWDPSAVVAAIREVASGTVVR